MKLLYLRTAVFISVFALIVAPIQAHAKDLEQNEASKLRQLRSELPAKIKEQAEHLGERVDTLESSIKKQPEAAVESQKPSASQQDTPKKELPAQKEATSERARQACTTHEARINTLITALNSERQQATEKITRISEAAQRFYTAKQLQVAHYDQLVSAVTRAKVIAEATHSQLLTNGSFSCEDSALHASMQMYQEKRVANAAGVRVYRDATKALVNAVRDASRTSTIESSSK